MTVDEDERKAEKRAKSEAQRLESIRVKKQLEKQRQAIMSQALREVDQKSKRVVFADSDDEEELPSTSSQTASVVKTSSKGPKLFEDSSSEESDEDEGQLKITNRHEGKKGEKLMKLEARFNSDSRFQLDEKFASSGSEDEDENEGAQERSKNLELLSKVLGSTVKPQKKTLKSSAKETTSGQTAFRPFTRFDPFNEEHVKWLQKEEAAANEKQEEDKSGDESAPEQEDIGDKKKKKSNGIHYEMQADFAEELKARLAGESTAEGSGANDGGTGFSFLAMMGRAAPSGEAEQETKNGSKEEDIVPNKKLKKLLGKDDDSDDGVDAKVTVPTSKPVLPSLSTSKFFVTGDEPYLQSLVSNFKRTQSLEKIVPRWSNHRDVFVKNYRHLRKTALKENRHKLLQSNGQEKSKAVEKKGKSFPKKRKAEEAKNG
ncbi:hypothetical protein Y032_0550g3306 [Ancylostoma ceylanicum]|uniref:Uncharacterized protein n=1 Tax=Ancylostoma ceylanicum TaxID=53326 RepID=A0A016WSE2_9BILA|nr:hypothetical protein Y032_0550g3306 [Ancylostoma ceylanicum]